MYYTAHAASNVTLLTCACLYNHNRSIETSYQALVQKVKTVTGRLIRGVNKEPAFFCKNLLDT